MDQAALTVVVPIERSDLAPLRALLQSIEADVRKRRLAAAKGALFPFADLATVHFARFVVIDPPATRSGAPPLLVFATSYDGSRARHLRELVAVAGDVLERVFSHCDRGLSGAGSDRLLAFLERNSGVGCNAFYVGHRGRSVSQILNESRLQLELESALGRASGRLCREPFAEALRCVRGREDLRWALSPPDPTRPPWYSRALRLLAFGLAALALAPVLAVWLLCIRALELRDARRSPDHSEQELQKDREAGRDHKRSLLLDEDLGVQNQMTAVADLKPGFLRLATLRVVLWAVDFLARALWDGTLNGIRTIHFARWFLVEQGGMHRLVFLSNYDGNWESYLGQFIDDAASGVTAIWSNTVGFPKAKWLIGSGARRELKFKRWVRARQIQTQVWYSAYPDLSVSNVQNDSKIRRGLQGLRGLEERRAWLRLL